jgi:hypothetical protein
MMSMPMASIPVPVASMPRFLAPLPPRSVCPGAARLKRSVATMTWVPTRVRLVPMAIPFAAGTDAHVSRSCPHTVPDGTSPES